MNVYKSTLCATARFPFLCCLCCQTSRCMSLYHVNTQFDTIFYAQNCCCCCYEYVTPIPANVASENANRIPGWKKRRKTLLYFSAATCTNVHPWSDCWFVLFWFFVLIFRTGSQRAFFLPFSAEYFSCIIHEVWRKILIDCQRGTVAGVEYTIKNLKPKPKRNSRRFFFHCTACTESTY